HALATVLHTPSLTTLFRSLAAGMASRYGSAKQVDGFGPNNEKIIDYSIYDAIRAGFGKVVFVIREEFLGIMKETFDEKLRGKIRSEEHTSELQSREKLVCR